MTAFFSFCKIIIALLGQIIPLSDINKNDKIAIKLSLQLRILEINRCQKLAVCEISIHIAL